MRKIIKKTRVQKIFLGVFAAFWYFYLGMKHFVENFFEILEKMMLSTSEDDLDGTEKAEKESFANQKVQSFFERIDKKLEEMTSIQNNLPEIQALDLRVEILFYKVRKMYNKSNLLVKSLIALCAITVLSSILTMSFGFGIQIIKDISIVCSIDRIWTTMANDTFNLNVIITFDLVAILIIGIYQAHKNFAIPRIIPKNGKPKIKALAKL